MAWIQTIDEQEAEGQLKELYDQVGAQRGGVANVLKVHSLNPKTLETHFELYKSIMFSKSPLSRRLREMIATTVSATNNCGYCKTHHGESLKRLKAPEGLAETLKTDFRQATIFESEMALLEYSSKLARTPDDVREEDIHALREHGYDDRAILDATLVTAYFCFVNRMVLGLGVQMETAFEKTCGDDARQATPPEPPAHG